jgi:hypothetical protein
VLPSPPTTTPNPLVNGDFEKGDRSGWMPIGDVAIVQDQLDPFTKSSLHTVGEGHYSAKIGDETPWGISGPQSSVLTQDVTVPPAGLDGGSAILQFAYAVVANDPPSHPDHDKPFFRTRIINLTTGKSLYDTDEVFTNQTSGQWYLGAGSNGLPLGAIFARGSGDRWVFKPWTLVERDLKGLEGQTLRIEFSVRDCNPSAHAAYGYLDGVYVGPPRKIALPSLVGNPQLAPFEGASTLGRLFGVGEQQLGSLWWLLCCLLPLLLLLAGLIGLRQRRRSLPSLEPVAPPVPPRTTEPSPKHKSGFRPKDDQESGQEQGGFRPPE